MALALLAAPLAAQQVSDTAFRPVIARPAHPAGRGPVVALDEAHHNFHTLDGRYAPFGALLARDGYRVRPSRVPFTAGALDSVRLLVVANAIAAENETTWAAPIHPAFSDAEVAAVRRWVEGGGSLLLIADHMPFGGGAATLGRAFGFGLSDGFAVDSAGQSLPDFSRAAGTLRAHPITDGRAPDERVEVVRTFTGQAFTAPAGAEPLLVLPAGSVQLLPDTAWVFTPATRRAPAGGLLQGAVLRVGRGRVAVFGEAAMFSAQLAGPNRVPAGMNAPGAAGNVTLLRNLVRWLTETR
ncbi:MAG: DUF4350 domain-containing protein [Gemmatimonadetes bacterium]|nr:DUF4350 domain-containing protein [Gemmatimonadota bacterium]